MGLRAFVRQMHHRVEYSRPAAPAATRLRSPNTRAIVVQRNTRIIPTRSRITGIAPAAPTYLEPGYYANVQAGKWQWAERVAPTVAPTMSYAPNATVIAPEENTRRVDTKYLEHDGTVIEGLGGWTLAYTGDLAQAATWPAFVGADALTVTDATLKQNTSQLQDYGMGSLRRNRAVLGNNDVFIRNLTLSGDADLTPYFHTRSMVKMANNGGGAGAQVYQLRAGAGTVTSLAVIDDDAGLGAFDGAILVTAIDSGSTYFVTTPAAWMTDNNIRDQWALVDVNFWGDLDGVALFQVFVNGADLGLSAHSTTMTADVPAPIDQLSILSVLSGAASNRAVGSHILFFGYAPGRVVDFQRHRQDAQDLGLTLLT